MSAVHCMPLAMTWPFVVPTNWSITAATRLRVTGSSCRPFLGSNHRFVRDVALFLRPEVAATFAFAFCAACLFPGMPRPVFCCKQHKQHIHLISKKKLTDKMCSLTTLHRSREISATENCKDKFCSGVSRHT